LEDIVPFRRRLSLIAQVRDFDRTFAIFCILLLPLLTFVSNISLPTQRPKNYARKETACKQSYPDRSRLYICKLQMRQCFYIALYIQFLPAFKLILIKNKCLRQVGEYEIYNIDLLII
jgi:hypothetical protein